MQTRSSSRLVSNPSSNQTPSTNPNPKGRNLRRSKQRIEEFNLEELSPPIVTMGNEDAIVVPAITADNFELKHGLLTLVQNKKFFGHDKEDPHAHIRYFNKITSTLKFPNVSNTEAWDRFKDLLRACPHHGFSELHQLDTFYNALNSKDQDSLNSAAGVVAKVSMNTSTSGISPDVAELKDMVKALLLDKKSQNQASTTVKGVEESSYQAPAYHALAPQTQGVLKEEFSTYVKANDAVMRNMQTQCQNMQNQLTNVTELLPKFVISDSTSTSSSGNLPSNTIANPRSDLKAITTRSGVSYDGTQIPHPPSFLPNVVENKPEATKDTVHPTNNGSTEDVQPPDLNFNISFVDALILMPKFGPSIKSLLTNKDKLYELAKTPLNEHCLAVLLKKLPEKLGDPSKFLIPCDFPGKAKCLALADLSASVNLMPLSVWNKLSLPDLSPTCMTLELADRSISRPVGVAKDVYVKVGTFHFPADFVIVDFNTDPRVPLILWRSFLKTGRALIDVFEGELTLRVGKEAITFNLDQTSRDSANYCDMMAKQIDVIGMACEEYSQEVLGFSDVIASGNPTSYYDPIFSTTSSTLTPFGNSDFLLKEVDAFFALEDDPTSPEVDQSYLNSEGDILLLEAFLNDDPSLPPPNQRNYLPEVRKELKVCEAKSDKSSIDEPLEVKLKELPPHLKYAFLEGGDKFPVIIAKDLSIEEKAALITDFKLAVQHQRSVNPKIYDVIKQEVLNLLDAGLIYPISDSPLVSLVHCVPKKSGFTIVENEENELILTRLVTGWRVCIDYRENHIHYPYGTFAYRHMPFGLCNAPGTFLRYMMAIFHDMIEKTIEVFMDDFLVFGNSFQSCLSYLERILERCEDTNLCLNWEKSHFMVKKGIVLGHKISKEGIEVDKAKVDVITKLAHSTTVKGIRSFLGHASFYRSFRKDFSKIARPMTYLLEKDSQFYFSKECVEAFQTLKRKLTKAPILIAPNWDMPFKLMCDASDFAIGAVLGQRQDKHFRPIHCAIKTMIEAEYNYTTTEMEMLAVVYAFEKFRSYLIINKSIMYTDHSPLKYLFAKKDSKARLLCWVLLLQEFTFKVIDTK
nr:reverse transcriptase domain-containing protein [Tanacetum cinerariifolium]